MNYPLISEYVEAIKAAEDNFDQLKHLRPVLDDDGEPVMTSGNFAVVFKMKDEQTGKLHAVKCFLKEQEGRAEAYRQIAEELEFVSSTFLTPIKYLDKELFVDSANSEDSEFPVLLMDWVEGQTLDKYIREHIDDQYELSLLAYQFSRLAMWLMPQPFAHGDLKPDNILVKEDGTLVLVDYDGMYVPTMKGQKARELGSPDFRHPSRTEDVFDEHIDDFSIVSILLSLKAIALQPDLLGQCGASDRLLFSENDYRNLAESQVMDALKAMMQDTELATLYSLLILSSAQNNLPQMSSRLLNLSRPKAPEYENLNIEVTEEDLANAWEDEYGVKYSLDRKRLLLASKDINGYSIRRGTIIICYGAFADHRNLSSISIPNSVRIIGNSSFVGCSSLTSVTIPKGVVKIGKLAFYGCTSLLSLTIPDSVEIIGNQIVSGCSVIKTIVVDKRNCHYDSRDNCNAIIESKSNKLVAGCSSTVIPNNIQEIGEYAFSGCIGLKSIIIPQSVETIGKWAFCGCEKLISVVLQEGLFNIYGGAFVSCESLRMISIPNSVSNIEKVLDATGEKYIGIFNNCYSLRSIIIPYGERNKYEMLLPEYKYILAEKEKIDLKIMKLNTHPTRFSIAKEPLGTEWSLEEFMDIYGERIGEYIAGGKKGIIHYEVYGDGNQDPIIVCVSDAVKKYNDIEINKDKIIVKVLESGFYCLCEKWTDIYIDSDITIDDYWIGDFTICKRGDKQGVACKTGIVIEPIYNKLMFRGYDGVVEIYDNDHEYDNPCGTILLGTYGEGLVCIKEFERTGNHLPKQSFIDRTGRKQIIFNEIWAKKNKVCLEKFDIPFYRRCHFVDGILEMNISDDEYSGVIYKINRLGWVVDIEPIQYKPFPDYY